MAQARETGFNPSSPHSSSGGADSYKHEGTPDTRLTAFSPDESSARSNKLLKTLSLNASTDSHPVRFHVQNTEGYRATPEKDPFVSSSTAFREQKLSPTASAFRPVHVPLVAHGSIYGLPGLTAASPGDFYHVGPDAAKFSKDLGISRYLVIFSHSKSVTINNVKDYISKLEQMVAPNQGAHHIASADSGVYLYFNHIQDARNVYDNVKFGNSDWEAEYISQTDFNQVNSPGARIISEGVVYVDASPGSGVNLNTVESTVHNFLHTQGEIFAIQRQSQPNNPAPFQALVEFCDANVAVHVAKELNGITIGGIHIVLTSWAGQQNTIASPEHRGPYTYSRAPLHEISDVFKGMNLSKPPHTHSQALVASGRHGQSPAGLHIPQQQIAMYPVVYHSHIPGPTRYMLDQTPTRSHSITPMSPMTPMSASVPIMAPMYTPPATPMALHSDYTSPRHMQSYARPDSRRQNAMRVNRSPFYNAAGHHNHVDVNRIRDGIDVRTTIMLRNIPNKVDQAMLKRIVDESSWGKYDFMYLRIDFANDCNVGYAFINFVDPLDIIDFVEARGNQRWNCFKSDKVAEISYATIQGKDCLVQKFRNSSVMLEAPHYRPKLYFTSNGPRPDLAGEEEPFPEPDNQSKMKRSCENAEHVGLFTPNAGQHFRDEQRRRRSQYDRGTRLAALEEYEFEPHLTNMQPQGLYSPQ
ncbi:RNA recognition motif 2-domain-containing protein [Podospora didyma]|uniref:RNA recognition motif 2-domain-containing protein n=1 Tax=Podospora didyma TaxID=330526 RepID=A0AAE0N2E4_9PEZI|nr:RNA recognition motif 2-domain-containing protein [Podospora didyma]